MPENLVKTELALGSKLSVIKLTNEIIEEASALGASDVHIDPQTKNLRVRYRVDGMLQDAHVCEKVFHSEIISRIKILSGLRTDEHYSAQDGRFRVILQNHNALDVRVSIAPTYYGRKFRI